MTVLTAGTALPVLVAGAGMGLASGLTGGAAGITNKVMTSKQMALVANFRSPHSPKPLPHAETTYFWQPYHFYCQAAR